LHHVRFGCWLRVQEAQGLLFAWGMSGPSAEAEAAATPPPLLPALLPENAAKWKFLFSWFQREVPYSFHTLLENVTDPAHVSFSHHGVQVRPRMH
jgi:phenylpropionate dioxygenase-like ring-hydroxylating dioxygenase large terminal subunit